MECWKIATRSYLDPNLGLPVYEFSRTSPRSRFYMKIWVMSVGASDVKNPMPETSCATF